MINEMRALAKEITSDEKKREIGSEMGQAVILYEYYVNRLARAYLSAQTKMREFQGVLAECENNSDQLGQEFTQERLFSYLKLVIKALEGESKT